MQTIIKNKWLSILILLLLVANIATLSMYWYTKLVKPENQQPAKRGEAANFLIKELGFNAEQEKKYRVLIEEHQKATRLASKALRAAKENYFDLLQENTVDSVSEKIALTEIVTTQQQLEQITFNHFKQVKDLCTAEQQLKFNTVIKKAMRMMGPMQPQQGPPPNRGERSGPPNGEEGPPPPPPGAEHPPH
jgi:Spy/CpxP family protein refolding chaperone